jgi:hypothetical protein
MVPPEPATNGTQSRHLRQKLRVGSIHDRIIKRRALVANRERPFSDGH